LSNLSQFFGKSKGNDLENLNVDEEESLNDNNTNNIGKNKPTKRNSNIKPLEEDEDQIGINFKKVEDESNKKRSKSEKQKKEIDSNKKGKSDNVNVVRNKSVSNKINKINKESSNNSKILDMFSKAQIIPQEKFYNLLV
jgi:hypothetical protein